MSRCCSIACYVLFSVLSFLRAIAVGGTFLVAHPQSLFYNAGTHLFHSSLQRNHVQVVEGHQMPVTAEDVHVVTDHAGAMPVPLTRNITGH